MVECFVFLRPAWPPTSELAKKDFAVKKNRLEVEKVLVGAGLTEEDYKDYIDTMVSDNAETSLKLANGLVTTVKARETAKDKAVRSELLNATPTPNGGAGNNQTTKTEGEKLVESLAKGKAESNKVSQSTLNYYTGGNK